VIQSLSLTRSPDGHTECAPTAPILCACGNPNVIAVRPGSVAFPAADVQHNLFGEAIGSVACEAVLERADVGWCGECWGNSLNLEP
jgi:hypothetical protein